MKSTIIILLPFIISCSVMSKHKNECIENTKFKEEFFNHIKYIENNISVNQDSSFISSVIFISNYTKVSFEHMMNYNRSYPIGIFKKDKEVWLKWYEDNKCKNIQLKKSYPIPERYKEIFEY